MGIDYSPSAATALLLANLTALAGRVVPNSTSTPTELVNESSSHPVHYIPSPAVGPSPTASPMVPNISSIDGILNHSLNLDQLVQDVLGKISSISPTTPSAPAPPSIYIINHAAVPVPTPASSNWTPEMDVVVGSVTSIFLMMAFGAGCWLLRRYKPDVWRSVKIVAMRIIRALALPISWLCGQASILLRRIHQEGASQVSYLISFLANWYTFSYVIGP
jgi:hypothetical protein